MNVCTFREQIAPRVPAWHPYLEKLAELGLQDPTSIITLRTGEQIPPFGPEMMLDVLGWHGDELAVKVIVGGPAHFGRILHLNRRFLHLFRLYELDLDDVHRSEPL